MQDNEFYIQSGSSEQIYGKCWIPDQSPVAVMAVLHGFADHTGRYEDFAQSFTGYRIAVIGLDLPGHGRSSGRRGHVRGLSYILNHIHQLMLEARRRFIDLPIFLYGHCMGGNFILNYALRHSSREIRGVIVSSPWIGISTFLVQKPGFVKRMLGKLDASYPLTLDLDPMELSHDPYTGKIHLDDPIKHDKLSMKLFHELMASSQWILENTWKMSYPLLIQHGNEDRITSWETSSDLAGRMKGKTTLKIWEGMRHELHHEKEKEVVLNFQLAWILNILDEATHR